MLVVFANQLDQRAKDIVARWTVQRAVLLTAEGLSVGGWRHYSDPSEQSIAMLQGKAVSTSEIRGVLVRWPAVIPQELGHIVPEDRRYVADEMTAFLRVWLAKLPCPVLNRPSSISLAGPAWRREEWMHAAARLGIPVSPVRRHAHYQPGQELTESGGPSYSAGSLVTVVGRRCIGEVDPVQAENALRLSEAAGAPLLELAFEGPEADAPLLYVSTMPGLWDSAADAVLEYFLDPPPIGVTPFLAQ